MQFKFPQFNHDSPLKYFFKTPQTYKDTVSKELYWIKYKRLKIIIPILIIFCILFLVRDFFLLNNTKIPLLKKTIIGDISFLISNIVVLFLINLKKPKTNKQISKYHKLIAFFFTLIVLCWAGYIGAINKIQTGSMDIFIVSLMLTSLLCVFSFATNIILYSIGPLFLLISYRALNPETFQIDFINLFGISVFALIISRFIQSVLIHNIIEKIELEKKNRLLKKTQLRIIQHEKFITIGQLSAGIAHEINNPIGFIKSNFSALKQHYFYLRNIYENHIKENIDKELTKDTKFAFNDIENLFSDSEEGFKRVIDIIKNLKFFSTANTENVFKMYNLNKSIDSTLLISQNLYKDIAVIEKEYSHIPEINCLGNEINQVLLNIIVNASQAMRIKQGKEKGKIQIQTFTEKDNVICDISNSGPKIPKEIRNKIFEPFFSTKNPGEGTGLGLSISYEIVVNHHKGKLILLDKKETCFRIVLPINH